MCHTCFLLKSHQLLRLLNSWLFNSGRLFFALPIIRFCLFKHAIWEQHQSSATPFFFGMSNSSKYNQIHFIYLHKHPGKDRKSTSHKNPWSFGGAVLVPKPCEADAQRQRYPDQCMAQTSCTLHNTWAGQRLALSGIKTLTLVYLLDSVSVWNVDNPWAFSMSFLNESLALPCSTSFGSLALDSLDSQRLNSATRRRRQNTCKPTGPTSQRVKEA